MGLWLRWRPHRNRQRVLSEFQRRIMMHRPVLRNLLISVTDCGDGSGLPVRSNRSRNRMASSISFRSERSSERISVTSTSCAFPTQLDGKPLFHSDTAYCEKVAHCFIVVRSKLTTLFRYAHRQPLIARCENLLRYSELRLAGALDYFW